MITNIDCTIGRSSNEPNFSRTILVGVTGCSYTQPYVANISPAGKNGILVEKCKIQMNQLTTALSDTSCHTSYVWLGGEAGKNI